VVVCPTNKKELVNGSLQRGFPFEAVGCILGKLKGYFWNDKLLLSLASLAILLSARVFSPRGCIGRGRGRGPAKIIHPIVELDCFVRY
jgi:hypothetical protein